MIIPEEYVVQKFYQYANKPKYNRLAQTYQGGCPICKEGKSWGTKRRLFYVTKKNLIFCHNCGWSGNPLKWIMQVTGDSYASIASEIQQLDNIIIPVVKEEKKEITQDLPEDCIDLFDSNQIEFYKNDKIVYAVVDYVKQRRLDVAINKPKKLYTSLKDFTHKNRLIIPFFDNNKPIYYQSRTVLITEEKRPKYLSKKNGEVSLFNIDNVIADIDYIFIFEGPIDSFFIKNGIAVAGIQENSYKTFTQLQAQQIKRYPLHKIIWVLDSQWQDEAGLKKSYKLAENEESIFVWPENIGKKFKDLNEMCCALKLNEINPEFVIKNSHSGLKAKLLLSQIKS